MSPPATRPRPKSPKPVRRRRGVRILADYLTILGFLSKQDDRYALTPDAQVFLARPRRRTWAGRWSSC